MNQNILFVIFFSIIVGKLHSKEFGAKVNNGDKAKIEDFPYTATIYNKNKEDCGAAIISKDIILTAAHCLVGADPLTQFTISVGTDDCRSGNDVYKVESYKFHEKYTGSTPNNDIGIIKLSRPLEFENKVQPIELAGPDNKISEGTLVTIAGCGNTIEYGKKKVYATRLWSTKMIVGNCSEVERKFDYETLFCAANKTGRTSACSGDSGAGFIADGRLVGIHSQGPSQCGQTYTAGVIKVSLFTQWIQDAIDELNGAPATIAKK